MEYLEEKCPLIFDPHFIMEPGPAQSLTPNLCVFTFRYLFVGILLINHEIPDVNVIE